MESSTTTLRNNVNNNTTTITNDDGGERESLQPIERSRSWRTHFDAVSPDKERFEEKFQLEINKRTVTIHQEEVRGLNTVG
jgi:hypothetical protein